MKDPAWIDKDWTQWTEKDCYNVLMKSPWSHVDNYAFESHHKMVVSGSYMTLVQLRSALPIRQAALRRLQLDKRYDKMNAEKRRAFDQLHAHDLDPSDHILVYIENWGSAEEGALRPRYTALILSDCRVVLPTKTKAVKYAPESFSTLQNEYEYAFPRTIAGEPIPPSGDSFLIVDLGGFLVFDAKTHQVALKSFRDSGQQYNFKISDLMYKGKPEY
ncbi:MAG TPA: hypothetical protein VLV89_12910 [Candidatus Acidoferrum sp.]|nr:hypothetical protein [Candidatus Acidoferrum sp.]